jgi:hypothetical protein
MKPTTGHDPEQLHSILLPQILFEFPLKIILPSPSPHHGKRQKTAFLSETNSKTRSRPGMFTSPNFKGPLKYCNEVYVRVVEWRRNTGSSKNDDKVFSSYQPRQAVKWRKKPTFRGRR